MKKYSVKKEKNIDRDEVVDFLSRMFGDNPKVSKRNFNIMFDYDPSVAPDNFVLARSATNELIGLVRIVERDVMVDGVPMKSAGVTSVAVAEEWRKKGVCSALMDRAIDDLIQRQFDVSLVFARKAVDGLYGRYGYVNVGRYTQLLLDNNGRTRPGSVKVRRFAKDDLSFCERMYRRYYYPLTGSIARSRRSWEFLINRLGEGKHQYKISIIYSGDKKIGYLIHINQELVEMCLAQKYYPECPALLRSLGAVSIKLHPRHPFVRFARLKWNTIYSERCAIEGGYMARLLCPGTLMPKLAQVLKARAAQLGLKNQKLKLLGYMIDLNTAGIIKSAGANDIEFTDSSQAVQLILGYMKLDDMVGVKFSRAKPWVRALFAQNEYHTSKCDEF